MGNTDQSLTSLSYDSILFWKHISETYGINTIRVFFENLGGLNANNITALDTATGSFKETFQNWLIKNVVKNWQDDGAQYLPDVSSLNYSTYPVSQISTNVNPWAADYIKFTGGTGGKLTINFDGEDGRQFFASAIGVKDSGASDVKNFTLDSGKKGAHIFENFGTDYGVVYLLVAGLDNSNPVSYDYSATFEPYSIQWNKETKFAIPPGTNSIELKFNFDGSVNKFNLNIKWPSPSNRPSLEVTSPDNVKSTYQDHYPFNIDFVNLAPAQKGEWKLRLAKDAGSLADNFGFTLRVEKPTGLDDGGSSSSSGGGGGVNFSNIDCVLMR